MANLSSSNPSGSDSSSSGSSSHSRPEYRTPGVIRNPHFNFGYFNQAGVPSAEITNIQPDIPSALFGPPWEHALTNSVLHDVDCQRRLMVAVHHLLTHPLVDPLAPEIKELYKGERRVVEKIMYHIRKNPERTLLLEAVLKWIGTRGLDEESILIASQDLAHLGRLTDFLDSSSKVYADIQRQVNGRSEVLQTRAATRLSNAIDLSNTAPGAFGLQIFSTHATNELAAYGGWAKYTMGANATLIMPPAEKKLDCSRTASCYHCHLSGYKKGCNMNSFGCNMCKLTEKVCSYEHLKYENTFKQDGRVLLADILPFKGTKQAKSKLKDLAKGTFNYRREESDDDSEDDQGPAPKKSQQQGRRTLSLPSQYHSTRNGQSSSRQGRDTEIPDFPNLMNKLSSEASVTYSANSFLNQHNLSLPTSSVRDLNEADSMATSPATPARGLPNITMDTPSSARPETPQERMKRVLAALAVSYDAEDEMDVTVTTPKRPSRAAKKGGALANKTPSPISKTKKSSRTRKLVEKNFAKGFGAMNEMGLQVSSPLTPLPVTKMCENVAFTNDFEIPMTPSPKRPIRATRQIAALAKKTPSPIKKPKAKISGQVISSSRITISLIRKNGELSFSPPDTSPLTDPLSDFDLDGSMLSYTPQKTATPTKNGKRQCRLQSPQKTSPLSAPPSDLDLDGSMPSYTPTRTSRAKRERRRSSTGKSMVTEMEEVIEDMGGMMMTGGCEMMNSKIAKAKRYSDDVNAFEKNGMDIDIDRESRMKVNKLRPKLKLTFKRTFASMQDAETTTDF